jgi:diguanylate cyclase (GGDEF)-like protein
MSRVIEKQQLVIENRRLYRAAQEELAKRRELEKQLAYSATHDPLTGLPNRSRISDRLSLELAHARRRKQRLILMMLDLDQFKKINDTLGHGMGDKVLRAVGKRLSGLLRKSDTVARIGGDEFMLILPELRQPEGAATVAVKVLESIRKPLVLDGHELNVTASVGVAIYPDHGQDAETLMHNADIAMYRAKGAGRNNWQCCTVRAAAAESQC